MNLIKCADCDRQFLDTARLHDHAAAVHTYGELRSLLSDAVREHFNSPCCEPVDPNGWGSGNVSCWVVDFSDTWVVFSCNCSHGDEDLYQVDYSITNNEVTLGDNPVEVVQRTSFEPVGDTNENESAACKPKKKMG